MNESEKTWARTDGKALYNIRRTSGRGMKRWMTLSQVTDWKNLYPEWRFKRLTEHGVVKPSTSYVGVNSHRYWGKNTFELREKARQTNNPVISYDDILDVMLAAGKGV